MKLEININMTVCVHFVIFRKYYTKIQLFIFEIENKVNKC